ncbi:DUF2778 domain-containing protein [Rhizobium alvei]|uniref:DUF2778 domain-containing protein n=1 Tax=Rhizobium alvei TaxID=1132659 RepID=A0ABT8YRH5_9HYPH|nr:DUF2778 domain-containing protein [Rhizobium alvei]MDO6966334.1 DUF2778 domain-containing protein [Rhizobium alvei]
MASPSKPARAASKSRTSRSLTIVASGLLACSILAGGVWALASTLHEMHEAAFGWHEARMSLDTRLNPARDMAAERHSERWAKAARFTSVSKPTTDEIRRRQLAAAAIRLTEQHHPDSHPAMAEAKRKDVASKIVTAFARIKDPAPQEDKVIQTSPMVLAYAEAVPTRDMPPFSLVLAKTETEEDFALPGIIPLPETRPLIETVVTEPKPDDEKPSLRAKKKNEKPVRELAYAKPERSLFGDLFKSKSNDSGWPGKGTRVAIYDVSNATVYMPDGTRLRAHSGIGRMRDNPRYEHVKMTGPTPAGIYRLSMREKRFYGVEAIRMTSIDGRDPKNRTGLLTHTNLLRGQIGSHGCVAFQNYQPFLKAFKRGHVTMLVVVPELPSSRTQLAALYRKAGA